MTFDFYISLLRSVRLVLSKNIMDGNQNKSICNDFLKTPYKNLRTAVEIGEVFTCPYYLYIKK